MSPDEKHPIAENEAPKEVEEPTVQQLADRAKAFWLNPLQTLAETYIRRGRTTLASILTSLENAESSKKKKE